MQGRLLKELSKTVEHKAEKEEVAKLAENTKENTEDIVKLRARLELLESKVMQLSKSLAELTVRVDKVEKSGRREPEKLVAPTAGAHIEEEEWVELKKTIDKLKKDFLDILKDLESLRELRKRVSILEQTMDTKLDKEEFEKWKQSSDLSQILAGITKKFADRNEMLRSLKKLEKRIELLEEMLHKETVAESADNALLAKRPLGGWSCASCQKDLINIEGMRVPYYPWNKLPVRDATERIAKVLHSPSVGGTRLLPHAVHAEARAHHQVAASWDRAAERLLRRGSPHGHRGRRGCPWTRPHPSLRFSSPKAQHCPRPSHSAPCQGTASPTFP